MCIRDRSRNRFVLYSGRLEEKFAKELDEDEIVTACSFNKDSSVALIGTSMGRVLGYRVGDGELDGQAF